MKNFTIIFFVLLSIKIYSCSCAPSPRLREAQKNEFEDSENVLIGDVIEIDKDFSTFKVRIKEVFKGNLFVEKIITFRNSKTCEPFVDRKGKWLIYASKNDNYYKMNFCGVSRNIEFPEENHRLLSPRLPPNPYEKPKSKYEYEKEWKEYLNNQRIFLIKETEIEINRLRIINTRKSVHNNG